MFVRFTLLALVAAASALPATDLPFPQPVTTITEDEFSAPWFSFPSLSSLFSPLFKLIPTFAELGPKISVDDHTFKIIVHAKGYEKNDLKIKVKDALIFVQGSHEAKQDDHDLFASQFFHTYTLPENASSADMTASLYIDGTLVISAPMTGSIDKSKQADREVPIIETGVPYYEEVKDEKTTEGSAGPTTPAAIPTTVVPEEDRKEPTTPEDATEKDNVIPHGNEVVNP